MKFALLVSPGLTPFAQHELAELLKIKGEIVDDSVLFSTEQFDLLTKLLLHAQTPRRVIAVLGRCKEPEQFSTKDKLSSYFSNGTSFMIEVENVKGQENRQAISKKIYESLQQKFNTEKIECKVDYKKPDLTVIVYFTGKEYLVGIDLCSQEINARDYRVFPHSGSLKGDLAYWLVGKSGFISGDKLLVGFVKDGAIAIEAALLATQKSFRNLDNYSFRRFPIYNSPFTDKEVKSGNPTIIHAFDNSLPNILAARKNIAIAGVKENVDVQRYTIEDLDARYDENSFDQMIFMITSKDEEKINELYYQVGLLLKKDGILLIIGREQWELPISEKFELVSSEKLPRGEGYSNVWVMKKK
mgnify:CR=1 FL=1